MYTEVVMDIICIIGVIAFGVSGAMVAVKKRTDPFGVVFLAVITATGGGITRDLLLGIQPPVIFIDYTYVIFAASAAIVVFFVARMYKDFYRTKTDRIDSINNVFDALGLGVFVVMGTQTAIDYGFAQNAFFTITIGVITGIGGGFLRDIMVGEIPTVLKKHIYVLAAFTGSIIFYFMYINSINYTLSAAFSAGITFAIRMLATHFKWNLPPAY